MDFKKTLQLEICVKKKIGLKSGCTKCVNVRNHRFRYYQQAAGIIEIYKSPKSTDSRVPQRKHCKPWKHKHSKVLNFYQVNWNLILVQPIRAWSTEFQLCIVENDTNCHSSCKYRNAFYLNRFWIENVRKWCNRPSCLVPKSIFSIYTV